ncbi:MAG TPA: hypothetical protein VF155_10925, partial [Candidatus Dormibacteraeota bacterium]
LLVHGEERYLVDGAVRSWRERVCARSPELDIEVFDAPPRLEAFRRSLAEVPLLDPERSVLLRDPPQLAATARRGSDPADVLARALAERAPTTSLCIVSHNRVAPQNPVLAEIRRLRGAVQYFAPLRGRELRTWLDRQIAARGLRLGRGAAEPLLQAAGSDLGALSSEVDKLVAYAAGRQLGAGDVTAAVAGDEPAQLWSALENLLGPTPARGAAVLDELLADGRSSQHLLSILAGQLRDLILAQAYMRVRGSAAGLAAELRIPEWRAERLARQARAVPPATAAAWLGELSEADRRVKAGEVGDQDALRVFGVRAARQVTAGRR